jgi:aspartyl/asparaginyl-tRNA synthetase
MLNTTRDDIERKLSIMDSLLSECPTLGEFMGMRIASGEGIGDYLNCFRYGMPPHGGYGLGLARLLKQLLNASSVRDVSFLFRGPNRLSP